MDASVPLHLNHEEFIHLHPIGFTINYTIHQSNIPRPNEGIHNQDLQKEKKTDMHAKTSKEIIHATQYLQVIPL